MQPNEPNPRPATRLLVTGCAGFIGYHVADRLLDAGSTVLGLDNKNSYYDVALKDARLARLTGRPGFSFKALDVAEHDRVLEAMADFKPEAVVHLAAQAGVRHSLAAPRAYTSANIDGFLSVLEACRHHPVRHLVYASSSSVYGDGARQPFSEDDPADRPVSLYAATKRANEMMAHSYSHLFRIPATGLRFFTVYGPWGRPDMAYFKFTKAILEGQPIEVFNGGRMRRDFTHVDDIVDALVELIDRPPTGAASAHGSGAPHRVLNIGGSAPVALDRFIAIIEEAVGKPALRINRPMQPGDVTETCADVRALTAAVGYAPRVPLDVGLRGFVEWYRGYYGA